MLEVVKSADQIVLVVEKKQILKIVRVNSVRNHRELFQNIGFSQNRLNKNVEPILAFPFSLRQLAAVWQKTFEEQFEGAKLILNWQLANLFFP